MSEKEWFTGSGQRVSFNEILEQIRDHADDGGLVAVGTDSQVKNKMCVFSTAICLHNADSQRGGRYFIKKINLPKKSFSALIQRIMTEAKDSIDLAQRIIEVHPDVDVEIHLDVSRSDKGTKTSKFSDSLVGYAIGSGFKCQIKPDAFVASSIADKHTK